MRGVLVLLAVITVLVPATVNSYEYSITIVEDYKNNWCSVSDLTPWGTNEADVVEKWLGNKAGWSKHFRNKDADVTKEDFGISNTGYQGLDEADFHFHFGHGYNLPVWGTFLALWDWSPCTGGLTVYPENVHKKWDLDNEWVFLHSCSVLSDVQGWGKALKYSHMIMGFSTTTYTSTELLEKFFQAAIDWDWDIYWAYYHATTEVYKGYESPVKAVIIADNSDQLYNDHLWGHGNVEPDEIPDDEKIVFREWVCSGGE